MKLEKKLRKQYKFEAPDKLDNIKESLGLNNTYKPYVKHKSPLIMFTTVLGVSALALVVAATYMVRVKDNEGGNLGIDIPINDIVIVVPDAPDQLGDVIPSSQLSLMINEVLGEERINVLEYMPKYLDTESYNTFKDAEEKSKCLNNVFNNLNTIINNANQLNDATDGTYKIPANNYEFNVTIKNNKAKIKTTIDDIYYELFTEESNNLVYYDVVIKDEKTEISYKYRENDIHVISKEYSNASHSDLTYLTGYDLRNNNGDIKITLNGEGNSKIKTIELGEKNDGTYRIKKDNFNYVFIDGNGLIAYYSNNKYYVINEDTNKNTFEVDYYDNLELNYKKLYSCADKQEFKTYFNYSI